METAGFRLSLHFNKGIHLSFGKFRRHAPEEMTIEKAQQFHAQWRDRRPQFATKDNFHHLLDRAHEELEEARAELPKNDRPLTPRERAKFGDELVDVFCFVLLASNYGAINLSHAWLGKMQELEDKYPAHMFQEDSGPFEEQYELARKLWKERKNVRET